MLGDPTTATAAEGERIFAEMVDGCVRRIMRWAPGRRRDAAMTQPRLPDGFAVQVDRRVRVLGDGAALLGGSPTRLLRLAPAAQTMLDDGRLKVHDAVSAQLARTLLDATVAHPRPAGGPSHRDVTVVIPVRDNVSGVRRLVELAARIARRRRRRRLRRPDASGRLRRRALRRRGAAARPQQGSGGGAQHRAGRLHHRLRRVPGLRRGAAARLARGAARSLLRSGRGAGRTADRRPVAKREHGGPLRGGALVAGPRSSRSAGGALRHGVLRSQRGDHLPPRGACRTSAASTRRCTPARMSTCAGGSSKPAPGCATSRSRWSPTITAPKCGIGWRARLSTGVGGAAVGAAPRQDGADGDLRLDAGGSGC